MTINFASFDRSEDISLFLSFTQQIVFKEYILQTVLFIEVLNCYIPNPIRSSIDIYPLCGFKSLI